MYEVELKLRAAHEPVRDRLADLGAEDLGTVSQTDTYYDAPDREFAQTDEALRIRLEEGNGRQQVRLTYKGPLVDEASKTRTEAETAVEDGETLREILERLGYEAAVAVHKERQRYRLDGCTVTLDTVSDLGEFVEVETETEGDIDPARDRAVAVLDRLGLDAEEQIRTSYLELVLASEA